MADSTHFDIVRNASDRSDVGKAGTVHHGSVSVAQLAARIHTVRFPTSENPDRLNSRIDIFEGFVIAGRCGHSASATRNRALPTPPCVPFGAPVQGFTTGVVIEGLDDDD